MTIKTKQVNTNGAWVKVDDEFGITLIDDSVYAIQVLGSAKLSYGATTPAADCFTISFPQPFTYEKKSGEDLYIFTDDTVGAVVTIAG